jgi:hypothetical protein
VLFAAIVSSHLFDSWKYNAFISREIKDVVIGTPVENGRFEIDANSLYSGPIDVLFSIALRDLALSEDALIDLTGKRCEILVTRPTGESETWEAVTIQCNRIGAGSQLVNSLFPLTSVSSSPVKKPSSRL